MKGCRKVCLGNIEFPGAYNWVGFGPVKSSMDWLLLHCFENKNATPLINTDS
jgi:hypothetical protein